MSDPVAIVARTAAQQLEAEGGPGLLAEVEAVLATRESPSTPPQYIDPVALASLIVAIASLAWTVYTDLRKRTAKPSAEVVARAPSGSPGGTRGRPPSRTTSSRSSSPRPSGPRPIRRVRRASRLLNTRGFPVRDLQLG
jgi:hypothetical protein